jgi:GntR family transcriptional regulator of arabinose operon
MIEESKILNQERIYLNLRNKLIAGIYSPHTQMPSLRELAASFGSSPGTVRQALVKLQYEGFIEAKHGKGYFACCPQESKIKHAMLLELTGNDHLYSNFVKGFRKYFSNHSNYVTNLENPRDYDKQPEALIKKLKLLSKTGLEVIFLDGEQVRFSPEEYLELLKRTKIYYYFNSKDTLNELNIPGVSTEWFHGLYIAIRHLLELGCRNILAFVGEPYNVACKQALEDSVADAKIHFVDRRQPQALNAIAALVKKERIDGFFSFGDIHVMKTLPLFREAGYRIPQDVAMIGYYNTPWCEHMEVPLTSVSIREHEMLKMVCDMYFGLEPERQVVLKPQVVIRESSLGFTGKSNRHK